MFTISLQAFRFVFCFPGTSIAKTMFFGVRRFQTTLHFVKCTAWVAMNKLGIIGPYWFEDDDDRSQTVNKGRYMAVLNKYWASLGRRRGVLRVSPWFQQCEATPHTANEILAWLRQRFEERLMRRCDEEWAPHSPDLNPPRFLSVGFPQRQCIPGKSTNT